MEGAAPVLLHWVRRCGYRRIACHLRYPRPDSDSQHSLGSLYVVDLQGVPHLLKVQKILSPCNSEKVPPSVADRRPLVMSLSNNVVSLSNHGVSLVVGLRYFAGFLRMSRMIPANGLPGYPLPPVPDCRKRPQD